jgi:formylmethanofuran dehydrogenase subunit E
MTAGDVMNSEEFKKCVAFHGHICPGLSIGFQAAQVALDRLKEVRAADEELVAIVETDACSADAVQILTGCTFGKGNFIYKDHGKMVLILLSRKTSRGVRVSLKPDAFQPSEEHMALIQKSISGEADADELKRYQELHLDQACRILETLPEQLFNITDVEMELPTRARIEPSEFCALCGEPVMPSKMKSLDGQKICRGCL